jgi:TrpR family transcriptional regulator, trp operon repressor
LHQLVYTSIIVCMNEHLYSELLDSLLYVKNKKELNALLHGLMTQKELEELPKRLEIFKLLKKGTTQHEIAHKVGVGIATVTRGSLELQRGNIQKTSWWRGLSPLRS